MARKKASEFADALLETAEGMHRTGMLDDRTYRRIIIRLLGKSALANVKPISGPEIREIRLRASLSQSSFARYFNRSRSYISQLERGIRQPKGAAVVLLNVIRRKGFEAIL